MHAESFLVLLCVHSRRIALSGACALAVLLWSSAAFAQQASITGTITDATVGLVPGVTVTVTNLANGGQAVGVTDDRGEYRLVNLQPGQYRVQAELSGFTTVVVPVVELLVGQNVTLPLALTIGEFNETVMVSGEGAFVDTAATRVAGNIDPRQMEALPLNGGNWMELAKNVKGITANTISNIPVRNESIQLNLDGQQVTTKLAAFTQGKLSREAIAEFQVVTNLFDVTQGRSDGLQVNAISRSGTNQIRGSVFGFFRDDALNAEDALTGTVLPYQNQQVGGSFGGPVVQDKLHYFVSSEYEREPGTETARPSALPGHEYVYSRRDTQLSSLTRVDYQPSPADRVSIRFNMWDTGTTPTSAGHPSNANGRDYHTKSILGTWARVGSTKVHELKVGYYNIWWDTALPAEGAERWFQYTFPGLTLGKSYSNPQTGKQHDPSVRYDLSWHKGSHDLKIGGEYIHSLYNYFIPTYREGIFNFSTLPADLATRIPIDAPYDPSRWNLAGLDSILLSFQRAFDPFDFQFDRQHPTWGIWAGDTWRLNDQWTVNYGIRWDVILNSQSFKDTNDVPAFIDNGSLAAATNIPEMAPGNFGYQRGPQNLTDFQPRGGFAWNVGGTNTFVVRGGTGVYVTQAIGDLTNQMKKGSRWIYNAYPNDGLPGFMQDPTRGVLTYDQAAAAPRQPQVGTVLSPDFKVPYTGQSSIGFQKQLDDVTGIDVDLVHWDMYRDTKTIDPNLFFDPSTGYNKDPAVFGRPNPEWQEITYYVSTGRQDYTALLSAMSRRLQRGMQGGVTHTWVLSAHDTGGRSFNNPPSNNQFDYLDGEYARSTVQSHTLRAWMAIELPGGVSTSVQYSYGSGGWNNATISTRPFGKPGANRLNLSSSGGSSPAITIPEAVRDRWDGPDVIASGAVIPRNALKGFSYQQVDLRVAKAISLPGGVTVSVMGEVFNLFNRANYTSVNSLLNPTSAATTARFGQPTGASIPRQGQLGFRVAW